MNIFNTSKNSLDEIVFENRNKMYGAYALRKDAAKYTNLGMVYALSPFILLALMAIIYGKTHPNNSSSAISALTTDTKKIIETAVIKIEHLQIVPDISFDKMKLTSQEDIILSNKAVTSLAENISASKNSLTDKKIKKTIT